MWSLILRIIRSCVYGFGFALGFMYCLVLILLYKCGLMSAEQINKHVGTGLVDE